MGWVVELTSAKYPWILVGIILVWAVVSTVAAAYYYSRFEELERMYSDVNSALEKVGSKLNVLVDDLMEALENATDSEAFGVALKLESCIATLREVCSIAGGRIHVNIGIDFGNGTRIWFNSTELRLGDTLFNATVKVIGVDYSVMQQLGVFINAIGGVSNNPGKLMYWIWWYWDSEIGEWRLGSVGCDRYVLSDGSTVIWVYESVAQWPPKPP